MATTLHTGATPLRTPRPGRRGSKRAAAAPNVAADERPPPAGDWRTRQEMIAKAAYYRAEQRAFAPGFELVDWLAAEAEVDAGFSGR